ncbi:helix-turn-helix domain-containing protein [Oceanospirillaceae bacterium]|nr:helix-turn-helix domain-containing protein [Oceanospirillaceae bacterium]
MAKISSSIASHIPCPVSERLKQARMQRKFSQRGLGIAAGIDEASASARMNQYERGKHVPDYQMLCSLAAVLCVPIPYFYANDDDAALLLNMALLSNEQQELIRELVKRINFNL